MVIQSGVAKPKAAPRFPVLNLPRFPSSAAPCLVASCFFFIFLVLLILFGYDAYSWQDLTRSQSASYRVCFPQEGPFPLFTGHRYLANQRPHYYTFFLLLGWSRPRIPPLLQAEAVKMKYLQKPLLLFLAVTTAIAAPVVPPYALQPRHESRILSRQQQNITQPVTFQTVETTETYVATASVTPLVLLLTHASSFPSFFQTSALPVNAPRPSHSPVGTITQTCQVTLTPITGANGAQSIREDKDCMYVVVPPGQTPPPPASSSGEGDNSVTAAPSNDSTTGSAAPPDQASSTQTTTDGQSSTSVTDAGATTSSASSTSLSADPSATTTSGSAIGTDSASASPSTTSVTSETVRTRRASNGDRRPHSHSTIDYLCGRIQHATAKHK